MNTKSVLAGLAVILGTVGIALAAEPPSATPAAPSKESREKMAMFHEQLAACLRSDKPIAECHEQAMKHHHEMGDEGCPMMDKDHHHHDHTMQKQPAKTDEAK